MFDPSKVIKKMLGPGVKTPKFGKPNSADLDGDGISNIMDCQPKNMFRQDGNKWERVDNKSRFPTGNFSLGTIAYEKNLPNEWFAHVIVTPFYIDEEKWKVYYEEENDNQFLGYGDFRNEISYGKGYNKEIALKVAASIMRRK